jgi:Domain of unknown function (DUF4160)
VPEAFREGPYVVLFYSNERHEPRHVHVRRDRQEVKIWLSDLSVARNRGFPQHEVNAIVRDLISPRREEIFEAWNEHFGN